jgi:hypothetical protein
LINYLVIFQKKNKKFPREKKKFCRFLIKSENKKKTKKNYFFLSVRLNLKYSKKNFINKIYLNRQKKNKNIKMVKDYTVENIKLVNSFKKYI